MVSYTECRGESESERRRQTLPEESEEFPWDEGKRGGGEDRSTGTGRPRLNLYQEEK